MMKRIFVFLCCCSLFLSCFFGCRTEQETDYVSFEEGMAGFSQFFVNENLVPDLSQHDMKIQMEKYSYQAQKITELIPGMHFDGTSGGGYSAECELFGFNNYYHRSDDSDVAIYSNSIYSKVLLEGLTLPLDLSFGDSIETVCKKTGISAAWFQGLTSGEKKVVYQSESITISILYHETPEESSMPIYDEAYHYILQYDRVYQRTKTVGVPVPETVTETLKLFFAGDSFDCFFAEVSEQYSY